MVKYPRIKWTSGLSGAFFITRFLDRSVTVNLDPDGTWCFLILGEDGEEGPYKSVQAAKDAAIEEIKWLERPKGRAARMK